MTQESKIKANKVLVKMLSNALDPLRDSIVKAYQDEYAPGDGYAIANHDPKGCNLMELYDMASCLLFEWSGDPDYDDIEEDFR